MAILCEYSASIEEQQDELTALQSIFEDDLQIIQGGDGHANICFNLTVRVNIPHDEIDLEAYIPVEDLPRRASSSGSDSDNELRCDRKGDKENGTSSDNFFDERNLDVLENGVEENSLREKDPLPDHCPHSLSRGIKPGFTRSVSLQHWHVKASIRHLTPIHLTCTFPPLYPTECPPEVSLACLWLTRGQLQELHERLMQLWTEAPNLPIVFTFG